MKNSLLFIILALVMSLCTNSYCNSKKIEKIQNDNDDMKSQIKLQEHKIDEYEQVLFRLNKELNLKDSKIDTLKKNK